MGAQSTRGGIQVTAIDPKTGAVVPPVIGESVASPVVEVRPDDGLALWQEWCSAVVGKGKRSRRYVIGQSMGAFKVILHVPEQIRRPGEPWRYTVDLNPIVRSFIDFCEEKKKAAR